MNNIINFFPEGVALGEAFVNREDERKFLINRIKNKRHTVLLAPRRYGKTSLVIKVANETGLPYCAIDFLAAYNEAYVRDQIVDKVSQLVFQLLPRFKQAQVSLLNIFKQMNPEISIGAFGQRLLLRLSNNPLQDITDLLLKLDETAKYFRKTAVIFFDEFQQINQLKNYHSIEASIRHAAERSQQIAYVFSGSNRHLLKLMFGDKSRPLYRLCQTLSVERIRKESYVPHLQQLAESKWHIHLSDEQLDRIFQLTELHPFYINVLCQLLWEKAYIASPDEINQVWQNYVKTQRQIISHDIIRLSINQRHLMTALAEMPVKELQSAEFLSTLRISASSAQQAAESLMQKDLVYKDENDLYRILDPAMKYYLNFILWNH